MTLADILRQYAADRINQAEQFYADTETKLRKLHQEIAALEKAKLATEGAVSRAEAGFPSLDICPECWIDRNLKSRLVATGMETSEDVPDGHDIHRCEQRHKRGIECQWYVVLPFE